MYIETWKWISTWIGTWTYVDIDLDVEINLNLDMNMNMDTDIDMDMDTDMDTHVPKKDPDWEDSSLYNTVKRRRFVRNQQN